MKLGSEKDLMKDHLEQEKGNWSDLLAGIVIELVNMLLCNNQKF